MEQTNVLKSNEFIKTIPKNKVIRYFLWFILSVYSIVGALFFLYQLNFLPGLNSQFKVNNIYPELGHAYITQLNSAPALGWVEKKFKLFQDGKALGPANSQHDTIRTIGNGAYDIGDNYLRFSTLNNSSLDNHVFTVERPYSIKSYFFYLFIVSLTLAIAYIIPTRQNLSYKTRIKKIVPWMTFLFLASGMISQVFFYIIPTVSSDSAGFLSVAQHILDLEFPHLGVFAPGYPLALVLIKAITHSSKLVNAYVASIQSLICLLSSLTLVYAVYRWSALLSILTSIITAIFIFNNPSVILYNSWLLADSFLCSLFVLYLAALILCLHPNNKPSSWFLLSVLTALAIYIKPVAQFLLPLSLLLFIYLIYNKKLNSRKRILSFGLPGPLLLGALLFYNLLIGGFLGFSNFSGLNFMGAACFGFPFIEHAQEEDIQKAADYSRIYFSKGEQELLAHSWNQTNLNILFTNKYADCLASVALPNIVPSNFKSQHRIKNIITFLELQQPLELNKKTTHTALYSIIHAPKTYLKFVVTGLRAVINNIFSYKNSLPWGWEILFMWITIHAVYRFFSSKGRDNLSFLFLAMIALFLLYLLVVCLVEPPIDRYTYPVTFIPFLIISLYPLFIYRQKR